MAKFQPFEDRRIAFCGLSRSPDKTMKLYSVVYGDGPLRAELFERGLELAMAAVPSRDLARGRPGLGFVVQHQGRTGDYIVACWWDRENELPTNVYLREGDVWREARDGESFCVWDMQIIWHERCAYVETLLSGQGETEYLERTL